jgi:threonine/homoserine/homoserine lactone efflux protein
MLFDTLGFAVSFGLSAVAIPGALQTNLLNVTLRQGWRRGLVLVFTPLLTDAIIAPLVLIFLQQLSEGVLDAIRIVGGLFLLFIAWGAYQQLRANATFGASGAEVSTESWQKVFLKGVGINFLTPGPYIFWATITGPKFLEVARESWVYAVAYLLGFYTVFIGGLLLLVFVFHRLGSISPLVTRRILQFTIVLLLFFGGRLIAEGLGLV